MNLLVRIDVALGYIDGKEHSAAVEIAPGAEWQQADATLNKFFMEIRKTIHQQYFPSARFFGDVAGTIQ